MNKIRHNKIRNKCSTCEMANARQRARLVGAPVGVPAAGLVRCASLLLLAGSVFSHSGLRARGAPFTHSDVAKDTCGFPELYPRQYVAYFSETPPDIDGRLDEQFWGDVGWSEPFVDIRGCDYKPQPRFDTRVKVRWDAAYLYIAAHLEEPQIWANITQHDQIIFHDNDFEVFVDAASSTHYYKELEINAHGATWALCLNKPYANSGYENSSRVFPSRGWDFSADVKYAVAVDGTLNVPSDKNRGWTVEMALPMQDLMYNNTREKPSANAMWRINFSRVEWLVHVVGDHYEKVPNTPEDNWVWSPQGEVAMHLPERWGFLQFAHGPVNATDPRADPHWTLRCMARFLYEAQDAYFKIHGSYASLASQLAPFDKSGVLAKGKCCSMPLISKTHTGYVGRLTSLAGDFEATISEDRLLVLQPTVPVHRAQ